MIYKTDLFESLIEKGYYQELVNFSEEKHKLQYESLFYEIKYSDIGFNSNNVTDAIFITGPSASGKTTFTNILKTKLENYGYNCSVVSLDNYYLNREKIMKMQNPEMKEGDQWKDCDYETPDALDVRYFRKQMRDYTNGLEITVPEYDFSSGKRVKGKLTLKPTEKDMLLIEGIHALNPGFSRNLPFRKTFNVYLSPFDRYDVVDKNKNIIGRVEPEQVRLMRRSYRDSLHRNAPLSINLKMWPNVRAGEEKYIKPCKKYADFFFNTSVTYELPFLAGKFKEMVKTLDEDEKKKLDEYFSIDLLNKIPTYYDFEVPEGSVFLEFCK